MNVHTKLYGMIFLVLHTDFDSLVPRLSWNANMYCAESLVSFIRKHDVIKIGQKQKGNVYTLFNQLHFTARCV